MSYRRQTVTRAESFKGRGYLPDLHPVHRADFEMGIISKTCGNLKKPFIFSMCPPKKINVLKERAWILKYADGRRCQGDMLLILLINGIIGGIIPLLIFAFLI